MIQQDKIVCIFGGSGFIGRYITQELAREGYRIKIASRIPEKAYALKTYGKVGQITPFLCNYNDPTAIEAAVKDCYAVINLVGILYKKGKNNFKRIHAEIPQNIAKACAAQKVEKLVHISALGIEGTKSKYACSKREGEKQVRENFPKATILRPSVVFGAGDNFFNMFAKMSLVLPALPLIGGGMTKFQPVFVGDIAEAVKNIVTAQHHEFDGKNYDLGGPEIVTFKEIYERIFAITDRHPKLITLSWTVAKLQGALMGLLPKPLLTADQVKSLKTDKIVGKGALTLKDLGIQPTAMASILPQYLSCYKKGGRFANKKAA